MGDELGQVLWKLQWIVNPFDVILGDCNVCTRRRLQWGTRFEVFEEFLLDIQFDAVQPRLHDRLISSRKHWERRARRTFPLLQWMRSGWFRVSSRTAIAATILSSGIWTKGSLLPGIGNWNNLYASFTFSISPFSTEKRDRRDRWNALYSFLFEEI